MKRVMIVGAPGSGKSTLAIALGQATGLPVFHMDHLHWKSGWVPRPMEEKRPMAIDIQNHEAWIFEGGMSATYDHRATRADTLIWLDLSVGLRLWRVTKRLVRYFGRSRPDMAPGCREGLNAEAFEFYAWIWRTRQTSHVRIARLIQEHPHLTVHHLTTRAAIARFQASFTG